MNESGLSARIDELESQVTTLQKAHKKAYNTEAVYNTKDTYGYAQAVEARGGTVLYISGITPWDKNLTLPANNLIDQLDHALSNLKLLLESKALTFAHLISLRCYVARSNYYQETPRMIEVLKKYLGESTQYTLTLIGVTGLAQPEQLVEVESIAVY